MSSVDPVIEKLIEVLRDLSSSRITDLIKAVQPVLDELRTAQSNDVYYNAETIWANIDNLIKFRGADPQMAKDIVLAAFEKNGTGQDLTRAVLNLIPSLVPMAATMTTATPMPPAYEEATENECHKCGGKAMMNSDICIECYVGETGGN